MASSSCSRKVTGRQMITCARCGACGAGNLSRKKVVLLQIVLNAATVAAAAVKAAAAAADAAAAAAAGPKGGWGTNMRKVSGSIIDGHTVRCRQCAFVVSQSHRLVVGKFSMALCHMWFQACS
jgi:hypothetical protein